MKAYFIPGLGADSRVFKNISLPENFSPIYLEWLLPESDESLETYALRMGEKIDATEPFVLIGLSFGGMIAIEISKTKPPAELVLISTIHVSNELPVLYKVAGKCRLHKLIPVKFFKRASLIKRIFTTETREDKTLLKKMIRSSDPKFIKWAINAILNWKNDVIPDHCVHIHGSSDEILPIKYTHPTHIINQGAHLMVITRAEEINRILAEELAKVIFELQRQEGTKQHKG